MTADGTPWRSGSAELDETGFSLVKRDIEVLMLAVKQLSASLQTAGVDAPAVQNLFNSFLGGDAFTDASTAIATTEINNLVPGLVTDGIDARLPWELSEGGTGIDLSGATDHSIVFKDTVTGHPHLVGYLNAGALGFLSQASGAPPTYTYLDSGTGGSLEVSLGALYSLVSGKRSSTTAPTDEQALLYNSSTTKWEGTTLIANVGGLLTKDSGGLIEIAAGTSTSVVGNSSATAGPCNAIQATADNWVLGRRGGVLTWAKVARAELADGTACTVIGRSTNSTGVTADISASADGQVLTRISGVLQFATVSGLPTVSSSDEGKTLWVNASGAWTATRDIVLGIGALSSSSTQGLLGVVTSNDGDYIKISASGIQLFDRSVSNTTALITINTGHASLTSTARALSLREIDVCDAGVARKMLVLASAPY